MGDRKGFRFGSYNEKICSETFAFSLDFEVSAPVVLFLRCLFGTLAVLRRLPLNMESWNGCLICTKLGQLLGLYDLEKHWI